MKKIQLTKGKYTLVDDSDFEYLNQWKWHFSGRYAWRNLPRETGKPRVRISMHRLINETPIGFDTDHINGDGLDNRKENLRTATRSQNMGNFNKTGIRGISKHGSGWQARIKVEFKQIYLGWFKEKKDAAKAYNTAAKKYFKEFATLNQV